MTDEEIRIQLPLALDVAGSVTQAVGALYPGAMISTSDPRVLAIQIPDASRRKRVSKKALASLKVDSDSPETDSQMTRFDGQTLSTTVPEALQILGRYALAVLEGVNGVANYVEQQMTIPSGRRLHFAVSWTEKQTPHELRLIAEHERDEARAALARVETYCESLDRVAALQSEPLVMVPAKSKRPTSAPRSEVTHEAL